MSTPLHVSRAQVGQQTIISSCPVDLFATVLELLNELLVLTASSTMYDVIIFQLNVLQAVIGEPIPNSTVIDYVAPNFRPLQPINGRRILYFAGASKLYCE